MRENITPEWVKHAIFYQIFPDRFAKSSRLRSPITSSHQDSDPTTYGYKGGDLLGVLEHLDYMQDLGATALYFCPIFQSASNHRYHTHDYYRVDPLLGGDAAFDELLAECTGAACASCWMACSTTAAVGSSSSTMCSKTAAPRPGSTGSSSPSTRPTPMITTDRLATPPGWGLHALPKFNTDNPHVREYIMRVGEYWMRKGIDGWRLDVPEEIKTPELLGRSSGSASRRSTPMPISSARSGWTPASGSRATSSTA